MQSVSAPQTTPRTNHKRRLLLWVGLFVVVALGLWLFERRSSMRPPVAGLPPDIQPRTPNQDISGYTRTTLAGRWPPDASFDEIRREWGATIDRALAELEQQLQGAETAQRPEIRASLASCLMAAGKPAKAHEVLTTARAELESLRGPAMQQQLANVVFAQGVAGLRLGENENCILCRGESSCILPIGPAAVHQNPHGSRLAIRHFTEYLYAFPDDYEVRWLLNLAHMTLGEHPDQVDPRFVISLEHFRKSDADIGKFRDIGHVVGVDRFNSAGGTILEDFDNDGWLDILVTPMDATQPLGLYRNTGDGRFEECAQSAGLADQSGGLTCVQTDYNNDGLIDIYIQRGAWLRNDTRPSLLRNEGNFQFVDVTAESGLLVPVSSNAAQWADYNNDGWLDLFVCCERQAHRLFRNRGDGTFEEVAQQAGVATDGRGFGKGCAWIDYDNDDFPDLFVTNLQGTAQLYHNNRDGTFSNITQRLAIDGPQQGFSCWAWDFDNDGWLDIFATSYDRTVKDVVQGLIGKPHRLHPNKLFQNQAGKYFRDVTQRAGLNLVFATMGSNFGDFDNDGWLDMYLGTGDPNLSMLVPNRMMKNQGGAKFLEITGSAGVGHLQKGHAVACGDWDRDGNVDIFIQMGGVLNGDNYHNILFQNPGHDHAWITLKLVGQKTNRAAIGARIKVVTDADQPLTIHRHVSSGSSFGANPLEQTIGLGGARRISTLEIHWPVSGTTQVFHDLPVNQALQITELDDVHKSLDWKRITPLERTRVELEKVQTRVAE